MVKTMNRIDSARALLSSRMDKGFGKKLAIGLGVTAAGLGALALANRKKGGEAPVPRPKVETPPRREMPHVDPESVKNFSGEMIDKARQQAAKPTRPTKSQIKRERRKKAKAAMAKHTQSPALFIDKRISQRKPGEIGKEETPRENLRYAKSQREIRAADLKKYAGTSKDKRRHNKQAIEQKVPWSVTNIEDNKTETNKIVKGRNFEDLSSEEQSRVKRLRAGRKSEGQRIRRNRPMLEREKYVYGKGDSRLDSARSLLSLVAPRMDVVSQNWTSRRTKQAQLNKLEKRSKRFMSKANQIERSRRNWD